MAKKEKQDRTPVLVRLSPETLELSDECWADWGYDSRHELLVDLIELGLAEYEKSTKGLRKKIFREIKAMIAGVESGEIELDA